jgi:hypothetical protein
MSRFDDLKPSRILGAIISGGRLKASQSKEQNERDPVVWSGHLLASASADGWIANFYCHAFGGSISAYLFPGGIVISSFPLGKYYVRLEDITAVIYHRKDFFACGVEIVHTSSMVIGPVYLGGVTPQSAFGRALNRLVGPDKWVDTEGQPATLPTEPEAALAEPEAVEPEHHVIAKIGGMWGKLGTVYLPKLSVEVCEDAIVFRASDIDWRSLTAQQVNWIEYKTKGTERGVKITHSSIEIDGPVFIGGVEEDSLFGEALDKLVGSAKVV